jgi:transcriptional activator protein UGA3
MSPGLSRGTDFERAATYHVNVFRVFALAAKLYLRQMVDRVGSISVESQLLVAQLLDGICHVLDTPAESALLFPLFVAGVDSITDADRARVSVLFGKIHASCGINNIKVAHDLLLMVWEKNESGQRYVDWALLANSCGWCLSFA